MSEELTLIESGREEQRARLEAMRDMMGSMGWRWFCAECQQEAENCREMLLVADGEQEIGRLQGRFDAFARVLGFEDMVDVMLDNLAEDE